jgi:hypothetical protein
VISQSPNLALDGPLPEYVQIITEGDWGGTWCRSCAPKIVEQDVLGFVLPLRVVDLKPLGLRIDEKKLRWSHRRVVTIRESPERNCRICDFDKNH